MRDNLLNVKIILKNEKKKVPRRINTRSLAIRCQFEKIAHVLPSWACAELSSESHWDWSCPKVEERRFSPSQIPFENMENQTGKCCLVLLAVCLICLSFCKGQQTSDFKSLEGLSSTQNLVSDLKIYTFIKFAFFFFNEI